MNTNGKDWRVEAFRIVAGFGWPAILLGGVLYFDHIEQREGSQRVADALVNQRVAIEKFAAALEKVAANDKERIDSERKESAEFLAVFKQQVDQLGIQGKRREKEIEVLTEILRELRENNR